MKDISLGRQSLGLRRKLWRKWYRPMGQLEQREGLRSWSYRWKYHQSYRRKHQYPKAEADSLEARRKCLIRQQDWGGHWGSLLSQDRQGHHHRLTQQQVHRSSKCNRLRLLLVKVREYQGEELKCRWKDQIGYQTGMHKLNHCFRNHRLAREQMLLKRVDRASRSSSQQHQLTFHIQVWRT